jgi:hypothetical protein
LKVPAPPVLAMIPGVAAEALPATQASAARAARTRRADPPQYVMLEWLFVAVS